MVKIKPENYLADTKVSAKDNKNSKGEVTSQSYSTVIPKPILNKLGLVKGQVLYWDINEENDIIITPERNPVTTPEEASIEAGNYILNDMLFNSMSTEYNSNILWFRLNLAEKQKPNEDKINALVDKYKAYSKPEEKEAFKQLVLYLTDYPINIPNQFEIMKETYKRITETD